MADALERDRVSPGDGADTMVVNVAWDPGPEGWVTLNSDGLVDYSAGIAAAGGLLRDSEGRCLLAYSMDLGACSITRAEMHAAIEGLQRVWDVGHRRVTLNSDGSVDYKVGKAAAGGLLRDSEGRCLLAYSMNLGACSITRAEMRGAIEGLQRVWNAGHRRVILKLDSRAAIALLTNGGETMNQHAMETLRFQELQDRDWTLMIQHAYREGDRAADF
ncbi:Putative ribonuclease H protein At1g65750 [Linum perenne]